MLKVVATNFIQPDKIDLAVKICQELMVATKKEEGCIFYDAYQEESDPTTITFLEAWTDKQALDNHIKSEHFVRLVPKLKELGRKDSDLRLYSKPL